MGVANAEAEPATAPAFTWLGASMVLLFAIPMALMGSGMADPRGGVGRFAGFTLYATPVLGYLFLILGSIRRERAMIVRMLFGTLYVLWLIGGAVLWVLGTIFTAGDSW